MNASVCERAGQFSDLGDRNRAVCRESARLEVVANRANNLPTGAMAGVKDPAQFLVLAEKGVGLVD
jgi:hypothetical protein